MAHIINGSHRKHHGELIIDDPDPMKSKGQQGKVAQATITCGHCNALVMIPPHCPAHLLPYALCWGCRRNICGKCDNIRAQTLKCDVIEAKLDRYEASQRLFNAAREN